MPDHDDGSLTPAERLASIEKKLDTILESYASVPIRLRALETVVYGGCGVCLLAVLGAVVTLVIRS